jgi:hypothetical protein
MSHAQSLRIPHHLGLLLDEAKTIWHGLLRNIISVPIDLSSTTCGGQVQSGAQSIWHDPLRV